MPTPPQQQPPLTSDPDPGGHDWSRDLVLNALQFLDPPIGTLVRAFPGADSAVASTDWLHAWFLRLVREVANGAQASVNKIVASGGGEELSLLARPPVTVRTRLVSVRPHFFRGFRRLKTAIRIHDDLVVIEGRNSSGKTSISEAIEWALTGQLSRRAAGDHGHASELAACIGNHFRPTDEDTWVELTLDVDGSRELLRRVLLKDYTTVASDAPESRVWHNGEELNNNQEDALYNKLFGGVHPILMQHTLRQFVHDDPTSRRRYFESLLQLDQFTALIERAVVGPTAVKQIDNPDGGHGLRALRGLLAELEKDSTMAAKHLSALKRLDKVAHTSVPMLLREHLCSIAQEAFAVVCAAAPDVDACRERLMHAQRSQREARLPLLTELKQSEAVARPTLETLRTQLAALQRARNARLESDALTAHVTDTQRRVAAFVAQLLARGAILQNADTQECPVCRIAPGSLSRDRVAEIIKISPLAEAREAALQAERDATLRAQHALSSLRRAVQGTLPKVPDEQRITTQTQSLPLPLRELVASAVVSARQVVQTGEAMLNEIDDIATSLQSRSDEDRSLASDKLTSMLDVLTDKFAGHSNHVRQLEEAVGTVAHDDAQYRLRERWLAVADATTAIVADLEWEHAKTIAKDMLDQIREGFIQLRARIVEAARDAFSTEMLAVWQHLRNDSGAQFHRLRVPEARGRGYKLEFELKALISDGLHQPEVDALRVFSESQVNAVGLAAYITRARRLGHKILMFDDPVQSMDEEHFRSFAANLVPALIEEGFQVVILTHSDTFARRIHDHHFLRTSYATLRTSPSRRKGCYVEEGNRRVAERLDAAVCSAADGDLARAWRFVRLAIERMYTLAYLREHIEFDPEAWMHMSAEDMWERGVKEIVVKADPGFAHRLREILSATAAGAHDKAATSETDITQAVKDLRKLLAPLRLGAG